MLHFSKERSLALRTGHAARIIHPRIIKGT
jgi:hypothetical protein